MARISDDELKLIKETVSLQRLVEGSGVQLKPHGDNLVGHCPFHDDKTPSLVVTPAKNLWHCLGACQCGGSVIDWVMKQDKVSFRHAVELLRTDLIPLAAECRADKNDDVAIAASTPTTLSPLLSDSADNQAALKQVIDYYHETLKQSPEALDYLAKRGLNHPELIERFKLGYANRTLGYRLPNKQTQLGDKLRSQLQRIGVLRDSGHEHFSGSVVIPIIDEQGIIHEVYGRKILGKRLRKGTPLHTYLPRPHRGVFNIHAFKNYQEIILCESLIDALTFYANGFYNVTSSFGVSGFTNDLLNAFKTHPIKKVWIAYDRDEAGNKAAEKLAPQLAELGIDCYRVLFPKNMDVNDYATHMSPADKSLDLVLRKAEWLCNGKGKQDDEHSENTSAALMSVVVESTEESETSLATKKENDATITSSTVPTILSDELSDIPANVKAHEVTLNLGERFYRVRGLQKNMSYEQLKINLLIKHQEQFHVDTLDIYSARHRAAYIKQASHELSLKEDLIKQDMGKLLLKLEELQDQQIQGILEKEDNKLPKLSDAELKSALAFLQSPHLLQTIQSDFAQLGIVGEDTNKLVGYLAATSRKLDKPLAVMVQSSSAAGKSSLMEAILSLMPAEERIHYSAMTGQALFYMGEHDLKHKILSIAEEEGATQTAYALKLLQSEGEVSIASTGKNPTTGNLETQEYRVEGPVMLFSTTTAIDIDEELMNRCLVLSVDESRDQTKAIHHAQRNKRTLAGLRARQSKQQLIELHQNAQRLLRPLAVLNPYADKLTFLDDKTRTRRDHEKYLTLIDSIALLHQYQREIKKDKHAGQITEYIEVTLADIDIANRLAHEVLGKTLDELPPQTRRLLQLIHEMVSQHCEQQEIKQSDYRFSRKTIREYTGFSDGQLKIHCHRLEELEYLFAHGGSRGRAIHYELLYDGELNKNTPHLMGLIDIERLKQTYDAQKSGSKEEKLGQTTKKSAPSQAQVSPKLGLSQGEENEKNTDKNRLKTTLSAQQAENALLEEKNHGFASHPSYSNGSNANTNPHAVSLLAAKG